MTEEETDLDEIRIRERKTAHRKLVHDIVLNEGCTIIEAEQKIEDSYKKWKIAHPFRGPE